MKTTTTFIRDTPYSFLKGTKKEDGSVFSRKIEKGGADYSNACMLFHRSNTDLSIGNKVVVENIY